MDSIQNSGLKEMNKIKYIGIWIVRCLDDVEL